MDIPALRESGWVAIRELGRGGGGVVYVAVSNALVRRFEMFGHRLEAEIKNQTGHSAAPLADDYVKSVPLLIDALMSAVRNRDGIAAVKVPHEPEARFTIEVAAMEKYTHPALLRLIDRDKGTAPKWFAAEFHARLSLEKKENASGYLGHPLEALEALRPIAEGLARIHRDGGIHRDVKPKNIFVADDSRLILGDFGITLPSPATERLTGTEPVHSPSWMPDWVQFDDDYTPAVDVFS